MKSGKIHYAWIILIVTFLSVIIAAVTNTMSGVMMIPFEKEFGWSRASISGAFAICITLVGFSGPFIAGLYQKFSVRKVLLVGMGTLLVAILLTSIMSQIWHLFIIWGIIIGLSAGAFLTVLNAYVATTWFEKKRGLALGLLTSSSAAGQLVFLPLMAYIVENYSWRNAVLTIFSFGVFIYVLLWIFMKNDPADVGVFPLGAEKSNKKQAKNVNPVKAAFDGFKLGAKSKVFWLLAGSFFVCGFSTSGLIGTHFISLCIDYGYKEVTAASILAFMGIFNIIGTTLSGYISDRFDNRWLLFWYYGLRGLSLLILPFALSTNSIIYLSAFAIFYGMDWIATVPPTIKLATDHFGKEKVGVIYGWIYTAHQLGAGAAAYGGGLVYSWLNAYQSIFIAAGIFCLVATLFVLNIKKRAVLNQNLSA
ncbi:MFS transporter [Bacillus sp. FJAT-25509]|uniref:MFS transporter n=1 Tax=Bacillus sp. FJAT-25509 TaxID=1712029 RepID=UPI000700DDCA|nr:MFS transporter [Bacillus sp. FJAT-25509]KQL38852.1 MFS transporter [Bacillus sp. FJAT-25509]